MSPSRLGSPAAISPIIKPGQLAHPLPPTEGSSTESTCCIPSQVVTAALLSNRVSGAAFVIFRRKTRTSVAILPTGSRGSRSPTPSEVTAAVRSGASSSIALTPRASPMRLLNPSLQLQQAWDVISGHSFEITHYGSILYRGRERALESTFVSNWLSDKGSLQRLERLSGSKKEYRFALYGPGNHTSSYKTFDQCNGKGTWRRLLGEPDDDVGREGKSTHIVFMQLPELLAQMVALGVKASELVRCLKQGEHGTLCLNFEPGKWTTPEEREGEQEESRDKAKEWKKGWWYTERQGMGIWIS
ncbi:hypothetical protein K440DRAFT_641662 [Wilcoxina mikolae CBS 423.85]|nr:hypothetical protein K440DRAFT_641662 [Wilcoxina mikolae CBS 423.85]